MVYNYQNQLYSNTPFKTGFSLKAPLSKPIKTVSDTIETSVDTFVGEEDKKSNKRRNAIVVGSTVLVLSGLVALLNPKFSPKLMEKLKHISSKAEHRAEVNKNDTLKSKFYTAYKNVADFTGRSLGFINNFNTAKDLGFKWFCTDKKEFLNVQNKTAQNVLKKTDGVIRKVLKKPHEAITKAFDKISKHTVLMKYSKASNKMNSLEELFAIHKSKLPKEQQVVLEQKLAEINKMREHFSKDKINQRFLEQEQSFSDLEYDFWAHCRKYKNEIARNKYSRKGTLKKDFSFWVQDMMQPTQNKLNVSGQKAVGRLTGENGAYKDVINLFEPYLSQEEKSIFAKHLSKASKSLKNANKTECIDYFDKKRDLVLGSAPTDILTALVGLGASGVALSTADDKEQRISRLLTGVFPVIGGLAASFVFAAQLVSGSVGLVAGAGISVLLNKIGSFVNKNIFGNKIEPEVINENS